MPEGEQRGGVDDADLAALAQPGREVGGLGCFIFAQRHLVGGFTGAVKG